MLITWAPSPIWWGSWVSSAPSMPPSPCTRWARCSCTTSTSPDTTARTLNSSPWTMWTRPLTSSSRSSIPRRCSSKVRVHSENSYDPVVQFCIARQRESPEDTRLLLINVKLSLVLDHDRYSWCPLPPWPGTSCDIDGPYKERPCMV